MNLIYWQERIYLVFSNSFLQREQDSLKTNIVEICKVLQKMHNLCGEFSLFSLLRNPQHPNEKGDRSKSPTNWRKVVQKHDDFPHFVYNHKGCLIKLVAMHELSVTQSILDISLRHASEANAKRITDIHLVIGQFSSIVDDSVQFYWEIISRDTIAQGSSLHFERIPGEMTCQDCGHTFHPTDQSFECPSCSSSKVSVTKGNEFRLDSIDIE